MSATSRINPDSFYVNGAPIPASYFQGLDSAQAGSINGDAGGTWSASGQINVGGAGMWCAGPWTGNTNQKITTPLGSGKRIVLAANDFPVLTPGHQLSTRFTATPCALGASASGAGAGVYRIPAAVAAGTPYQTALVGRGQGSRWLVPLRVLAGATLANAELTFFVSQSHNPVTNPSPPPSTFLHWPVAMPQMRIYSLSAGGVITPLGANTGSPSGFVSFPAPATVGAYVGMPLTLNYQIAPGTVIDKSRYSYMAEIVDESDGADLATGARALSVPGAMYEYVYSYFTNIGTLGFQ